MPVKSIRIKLDKQRRLCFNYNALAELEGQFGISFENIQTLLSGPGMLKNFRALLWAGLLDEDESLTLKDVGRILDESDWINRSGELTEAIVKAINEAFPVGKKTVKKNESKTGRNTSNQAIS